MVVRRRRKRNQQRRLARRAQLCNRTPRPRQHQVRCRILRRHVRQKRLDRPARCVGSALRIRSPGLFQTPRSGLMHNRQPRHLVQQLGHNLRHRVVEDLRAIAAGRHQQSRRRTHRPWRQLKDLRPHRNPRHLSLAKVTRRLRKVHRRSSHSLAHHAVGHPRYRIWLVRQRRYAQQDRCDHRRPTRIATHAHHNLGLELAQQRHTPQHAHRQIGHRAQPRRQAYILQLSRPHQFQPKPRLGHQPRLQPARRTHKAHISSMLVAQLAPNRQRRNHVPTGPTPGDHHP